MSSPALLQKSKAITLTLPAPLADRIERARASRAIGSAAPPVAAVVLAAVERGIVILEASPLDAPMVRS